MDFGFDYLWTIEATLALAKPIAAADAIAARDLAAQEGMRIAADRMVQLTWVQMIVAAITAVGLVYSLEMTRRALRHSEASIHLGRATLQLGRASADLELRAYLGVEPSQASVIGERRGSTFQIAHQIRNYGNTATQGFAPYGHMYLVKAPPSAAKAIHLAPRLKPWRQLMPGQSVTLTTRLSGLDGRALKMVAAGKWCVIHIFRLRYETAFRSIAGLQLGRDSVHWGPGLQFERPLQGSDEDDHTVTD